MTTTATRPAPFDPDAPAARTHLLGSEWLKLRSVRSSAWSLFVAALCVVGLGVLLSWAVVASWDSTPEAERATGPELISVSLVGVFLAQLAVGVLGVLVISAEYATGLIRTTFTAVPQRTRVLVAKAVVLAAVVWVISTLSALAAFLLGQLIMTSTGESAGIGDPDVLRVIFGSGLYLTGVALLGFGLGALLRRTAGAISALVAILLVIPILANFLPASWREDVIKLLPDSAGAQILSVEADPTLLAPWTGFALFCFYIAALLVVAAVLTERRDT